MHTFKWSVRNVEHEAVERLREVQATSGGLLGELLTEAVFDWFENLPEEAGNQESIAPTREQQTSDSPIAGTDGYSLHERGAMVPSSHEVGCLALGNGED
jgi:hypothetical protein